MHYGADPRVCRAGTLLGAIILSILFIPLAEAQGDSNVCAACHQKIVEAYAKTGMAKSFYRPTPANTADNATYYHKPSDSYFTMLRRERQYYQRRYQLDPAGKQINVMEKQIDYIMGSGNHSRAYLHRTAQNKLIELPLAWYSENGGYWAMNPGYDRPDHDGFRRGITYDCMFCHNAYPQIPAGHEQPFAEPVYTASLPEGIDCQRCHGDVARHVQLAKTAGSKPDAIRKAILNPSRLSAERQMEVCMQCHLETTSFPLPNALPRYERGPFSYQPGEPLADFIINFDHAAGKGRDDKFEIVNAAYRLRRSACFLKSSGALRCTTCHNPHDVPRGPDAAKHYDAACRQCHTSGEHMRSAGCIDCHMPKRRTEDVIHVVATDHYIQRRKPAGDLLAELTERHETDATAYRGEVVLYYPAKLPATPENDLYLALAQVIQKSNLTDGITRLAAAIERYRSQRPEYYLELADAWRNKGDLTKALPLYAEAVRRDSGSAAGLRKYGSALRRSGQYAEAIKVLQRAISAGPLTAITWHELGLTYRAEGKVTDAVAALAKAIELDPDLSEAHNNLGIIRLATGDRIRADSAFREAIRIQPDYVDAHSNLGNLLAGADRLDEASDQFQIALRLRPADATTRYNYAMVLGRTQHFDEAQRELEMALRTDPELGDAHLLLANLLLAKGQVQPAIPHLQKAAASSDPAVRDEAAQLLRQLPK